jgi:hypothetical protein
MLQFNINEDSDFDVDALCGRISGQMLLPQASDLLLP